MPGVFDALSARIACDAGFEVIFISGYSVSAVTLAEPDFGYISLPDIAEAARRVCSVASASDVPVIVDADTGYGNALNVAHTVRQLQNAGAAGMFLEDQLWPKKCGHMRGKRVIPAERTHSKNSRCHRRARQTAISSSSPAPMRAKSTASRTPSSVASATRRRARMRFSWKRRSRWAS